MYESEKRDAPDLSAPELQWMVDNHIQALEDEEKRMALAKHERGDTVFDWIVHIILAHPNIELRLK